MSLQTKVCSGGLDTGATGQESVEDTGLRFGAEARGRRG